MQTQRQTLQSLNALLAPFTKHFQNELLQQASSHAPLLTTISRYYMLQPSKRLRPCLILLMCQSTNGLGSELEKKRATSTQDAGVAFGVTESGIFENILPAQLCLAQVFEILHVASLLHDDVIDNAETRRGAPSAPVIFGNRHSILGGDFLLGRAMRLAGSLGSPEVVVLVADVFSTLVEGELLQAGYTDFRESLGDSDGPVRMFADLSLFFAEDEVISRLCSQYVQKTYMKTAKLFAHAMECATIIGGAPVGDPRRSAATSFGECIGMAFQIIDDLLDFEGDAQKLGKPSNADMKLGLVTAPVLFALQEDQTIRPRVLRCFTEPGDVEATAECVKKTRAFIRTRDVAECYAAKAREALRVLPKSAAKEALIDLTFAILSRTN